MCSGITCSDISNFRSVPNDGPDLGAGAVGEEQGKGVFHEDAHGGAAIGVVDVVVALAHGPCACVGAALLHLRADRLAAVHEAAFLRVVQPMRPLQQPIQSRQ